jgi:hypothetical protein
MRKPGQCAKMLTPDWLWHGALPRSSRQSACARPRGTTSCCRTWYRSIDISSLSCIIAGQM